MIIANPVTYDARNLQTTIPAMAARAVASRPQLAAVRAYSRPAADAEAAAAGWQVREEPEDYLPDRLSDPDEAADPELIEAADAHAKDLREAMALLDDAENLVAVLMASVEHEGDSRAMQAEAVLKIVRKKLRKAHVRIDRQDARHQELFAAYCELKGRAEEGGE
jgi:hypothetical protein